MTKQDIIDLIKDSGFGFMATMEENQPRVRPIMPFITEDGTILSARMAQCRTLEQIRQNPLFELCHVDRTMNFCRIAGTASINDDAEKKELLWNNLPMLKQYFSGPEDPNFALVEMKVQSVEAMTPAQQEPEKVDFS